MEGTLYGQGVLLECPLCGQEVPDGLSQEEISENLLLGLRVRAARKAKKWSLQVLAEHCNASAKGLQHVEYGYRWPSVPCLIRIARALDVSVDALTEGMRGRD